MPVCGATKTFGTKNYVLCMSLLHWWQRVVGSFIAEKMADRLVGVPSLFSNGDVG